jgi:hypothetical protein
MLMVVLCVEPDRVSETGFVSVLWLKRWGETLSWGLQF